MIHSKDLDFSFSGLKTAVLYLLKKKAEGIKSLPLAGPPFKKGGIEDDLTPELKAHIAREFEDAVAEALVGKTRKAIEKYGTQTLLIGGGVIANAHIRREFESLSDELGISLLIPELSLTTDNALMIALAGYFNANSAVTETTGLLKIKADGNLHF